jgi:hypothetical protein
MGCTALRDGIEDKFQLEVGIQCAGEHDLSRCAFRCVVRALKLGWIETRGDRGRRASESLQNFASARVVGDDESRGRPYDPGFYPKVDPISQRADRVVWVPPPKVVDVRDPGACSADKPGDDVC